MKSASKAQTQSKKAFSASNQKVQSEHFSSKYIFNVLINFTILILAIQELKNHQTFISKQTRSPMPSTIASFNSPANGPLINRSNLVLGEFSSANKSAASYIASIFGLFAIGAAFPVLVIFSCIAYVARLREEAQEPGYSNSQKL